MGELWEVRTAEAERVGRVGFEVRLQEVAAAAAAATAAAVVSGDDRVDFEVGFTGGFGFLRGCKSVDFGGCLAFRLERRSDGDGVYFRDGKS